MTFRYCVDNNAYLLQIKEQIIVLKTEDAKELQKMINEEINKTPSLEFTSSKES